MIDWNTVSLDTLRFNICGDEITQKSDTVFLPVHVLGQDDTVLFRHIVTLGQEFYLELRLLNDWSEQLHAICKSRVLAALEKTRNNAHLPVEDKLKIFHESPKELATEK